MKPKKAKLPITDIINRNKIISICVNFALTLFFSLTRLSLRPFQSSNGSLVIISLHKLGDTIFTIPAIKEVYKIYGQKIIIICFPESIPIYRLEFANVKIIPVKHNEFLLGQRLANHSAKSKLKNLRPEIILDLTGTMISASLIYNIKAKQIIGINKKQFSAIYDQFVSVREELQLINIYLDAISPLTNVVSRIDSKKQKTIIEFNGRILIHPYAGWKEKEWSLKKFISLANRLNANYQVSLITQKNQLNDDVIDEITQLNIELIQTNSVDDLIQTIKECSTFIGNDSGPVNIANFLGKPTLSIYGATNPEFTASKEEHQIIVQKLLCCSSKQNEKYCIIGVGVYNCPGVQCMNLLSVDEVYNKVTPIIKENCNSAKCNNVI